MPDFTVDLEKVICAENGKRFEKTEHHTEGLVSRIQHHIANWIKRNTDALRLFWIITLLAAYFVYLGFAIIYSFQGSITLIVFTALTIAAVLYKLIRDKCGTRISHAIIQPISNIWDNYWPVTKWVFYPVLILAIILYFGLIVIQSSSQLRPLVTLVVLFAIPTITCKYPKQIKWRPVLWGLCLQLVLGIMVLRWKPGYDAVKFISEQLNKFLMYSLEGAAVVFGDPTLFLHPFIGIVVPLVIYIGAVLGLLYYLGITQLILTKFGWLMSKTFHTTAVESVSLVANLFFSVVEIILIIKPYTAKLTKSEFHTVLVGSHASIAGFAYAIFVWFGVNPQHLLTAAVMSAPAAVAISKLNFPETEESYYKDESVIRFNKSTETNLVEAVCNGAKQAGKSVGALVLMVIAFISLYYFVDSTASWLGSRAGLETSLSTVFSYAFRPLAYMFGVDWEECDTVATVLGIKLLPNEMLAYLELGELRVKGQLSERSAALTTYAICGFSSVGTLMMFIGVWRTVNAGSDTTRVATAIPRVYMNTNIACFITACVAGTLYDEKIIAQIDSNPPPAWSLATLLDALPSYKTLLNLLPGYNF